MAESPCENVVVPKGLSYFTASFSGVLSIVTIAGNLAVCIAVLKDPYKKLRTPFMYFLVNLSLSDLVVGCITMPISVVTHTMEAVGTKKQIHFDLMLMTYFISATASLLSLAVLCVDRYFAVAHPYKYRQNGKFRRCVIVSVLVWVVSLSLPMLYFVTGYVPYLMIFAHTGVVIALVIIVFSYFKIYKVLRTVELPTSGVSTTDGEEGNQSTRREEKTRRSENKVTRVFLIILGVFAACYVPVIVMIYILQFCPGCDCNFRHVLRDLQFLLAISNSAIHPFICSLRLQPFRDALLKIVGLPESANLYSVSQSRSRQGGSNVLEGCDATSAEEL